MNFKDLPGLEILVKIPGLSRILCTNLSHVVTGVSLVILVATNRGAVKANGTKKLTKVSFGDLETSWHCIMLQVSVIHPTK